MSDDAPRTITVTHDVDAAFVQGAGVVQGGVLAGLLGDAMTTLIRAGGDLATRVVLEALDVAFLRPATAGTFEVTATVLHRGRSMGHVEARIVDAGGRTVASGRATVAIAVAITAAGSDVDPAAAR